MNTPIIDFVNDYIKSDVTRFHMPGHKGVSFFGFEKYDITEIKGADDLSCPDGIIRESEENAASLFGTKATLYSTGGSSQSINAMLHLAYINRKKNNVAPFVLAGRNAHKAFIFAAAKIGFNVKWMYPDSCDSLCSCVITADILKKALRNSDDRPFAVYITTPDYLGKLTDINALSRVCREYDIPLLVDNAHGAYSAFTEKPFHPILQGADMCCDSSHKTLPALTGCGYLHIAKGDRYNFYENAKAAMTVYGTSSPSYLLLQSLDLCNVYIEKNIKKDLKSCAKKVAEITELLNLKGIKNASEESIKITADFSKLDINGFNIPGHFRKYNIEFEYADKDFVVFMATAKNSDKDFSRLKKAVEALPDFRKVTKKAEFSFVKGQQKMTIRNAVFAKCTEIPVEKAQGKICGTPTVSCPPAIPIVVSGEEITDEHIKLLKYYGKTHISVVNE